MSAQYWESAGNCIDLFLFWESAGNLIDFFFFELRGGLKLILIIEDIFKFVL